MTKSDKLTASKIRPAARVIAAQLGLEAEAIIPVSAHTSLGKKQLWHAMEALAAASGHASA